MKRLIRPIHASTKTQTTGLNFTPEEIVILLREIEELRGKEIDYGINQDGNVEFIVGEGIYTYIDNQEML